MHTENSGTIIESLCFKIVKTMFIKNLIEHTVYLNAMKENKNLEFIKNI